MNRAPAFTIHGLTPSSSGARADDAGLPAAGDALRGSPERVPAGRDDHALRDLGRACSTTAGDRPIRWAGWCCASPATTMRASTSSRMRSARRCSWRISGRISGATGPSAGSTCRATIGSVPARARRIWPPARMTPEWRSVMRGDGSAHARALCRRARRLRRRRRAAPLGAAPHVARRARAFSTQLERADYDVFNHRPTIGEARHPRS